MKILNSILGAIITFFLLLGITFKIMHWPGAGVLIILSASSLSLYLIPVAIGNIMSYKNKVLISICNGIGVFAGMILSTGLLFKIMHWPGAGVFLLIGKFFISIVIIFFMILYIASKEPIKLSPGTFFSTICFGLLIYNVSLGSSSKSLLWNITNNAIEMESNITMQAMELDIHSMSTPIAKPLQQATGKLYYHIESLKSKLISETSVLPKEVSDTISLEYINGKDNYDIPTYLLGIADPASPTKVSGLEEFSAITLKEEIIQFNSTLKEFDNTIEPINVDDINVNGTTESWETATFYHFTIVQVILTLNTIELEAFSKANYLITKKYYSTLNQPTTSN